MYEPACVSVHAYVRWLFYYCAVVIKLQNLRKALLNTQMYLNIEGIFKDK
jgi:hypothetical protein